jgi:transcriptional antiterminator
MNNKKKKTISHLTAVIEHLVMFTQNYIKKKKKKKKNLVINFLYITYICCKKKIIIIKICVLDMVK